MNNGWRTVVVLAAAALAAAGAARAQDTAAPAVAPGAVAAGADSSAAGFTGSASGFLWAAFTARESNEDYNPNNTAGVPTSASDMAGVLDWRLAGATGRWRASWVERRLPGAGGASLERTTRLSLTQVKWALPLGEQTSLTVGRINLALDDGQSFHPLDFFEDTLRGTDFEDRAGRSRGFPLLMLGRSSEASGLRLVLSDDALTRNDYTYGDPNANFNRGRQQALASWRHSIGQWSVTGLARRAWPGRTGVGFSTSWVGAAAWSMHAAAYVERGNDLPLHRNVYLGRVTGLGGGDVYINESPMQAWAAGDDRWRTRWLLGATWTGEGGETLLAELWRDERGMSRAQQHTWRQVFAFHDGLANTVARTVNVGYDLEALRTPAGVHAFLRYQWPVGDGGTLQVSNLLASDRSGSAAVRWTGHPADAWEASLEAWHRYGPRLSQYGAVPDRLGVSLSLRRFF